MLRFQFQSVEEEGCKEDGVLPDKRREVKSKKSHAKDWKDWEASND